MVRMRARLARLLRRPAGEAPPPVNELAAREARIAAASARAWCGRLAERARREDSVRAIVAALLATEQAAARHAARCVAQEPGAEAMRRSDGKPPLLH
jgi:hypothetical protein